MFDLISSFVAFCPFHIVHLTEFKESQLMMFLRICPYYGIIIILPKCEIYLTQQTQGSLF